MRALERSAIIPELKSQRSDGLLYPQGRYSVRSWFASEDWFAVWLGLAVVLIALPTAAGIDLLGWVAAPRIWLNPMDAVRPVSTNYAALSGLVSLLFTYLLILGLVGAPRGSQED